MFRGANPGAVPNFYRQSIHPIIHQEDKKPSIVFLQDRLLLKNHHTCTCGNPAKMIRRQAVKDHHIW